MGEKPFLLSLGVELQDIIYPTSQLSAVDTGTPRLKDPSAHLLKQLQAVRVVIISKVDDSSLAAVDVECLSQPSQCKVPLHGAPGDLRVSRVPPKLIVPWCLYIEVGVVQPSFAQKPRDERCPPLRVLHQDPVQVGNVQESVGQSCQFCLLHWPAVGGGDNVDGGQHIRPWWRPGIHILCPHDLHYVLIWGTVFLGVLYVASCLSSALSSINCRWGRIRRHEMH